MKYTGHCHCGTVTFSFESETIEKGLRCNCSICARKGALMSDFVLDAEELKVESGEEALTEYRFGQEKAKHYFCSVCGIYPFHETARFAGKYRVNLGCIEDLETTSMEYVLFDGKHLL